MALKSGQRTADVMGFMRKRFDLLKITVIALRGHRPKKEGDPYSGSPTEIPDLDLNLEPQAPGV